MTNVFLSSTHSMATIQGDLPLQVQGIGSWILPALSTLPGIHPSPDQSGRVIFVGESLETVLVTPPQIITSNEDNYLVSERALTKLADLSFPQRITAADGSTFAAASRECVVSLFVSQPAMSTVVSESDQDQGRDLHTTLMHDL
jgi:hypothetical protein